MPPLQMLPFEVDRLLPSALDDVKRLVEQPWPDPPNPVKRNEFIAQTSRRFDHAVARLNQLLAAWKELQIERLGDGMQK